MWEGVSFSQNAVTLRKKGRCTQRSLKSGCIVKSSLYRNLYELDLINYFLPNMEGKWMFFKELQIYVKDACFCCLYCFL